MDVDPATVAIIASSTVTLLSPYLKSFLEGFTKKTGEQLGAKSGELAWNKAKQIHQLIRSRFATEPDTKQAMTILENNPDDLEAQAAARSQLERSMASDSDFARQIIILLKEADQAGADAVFSTNIHGNVNKLAQIHNVYGDVTL